MELLKNLSFNELNDHDLSLKYAEELITLAKLANNNKYLHSGYLQKGDKHKKNGDFNLALDAFFNCAGAAKKADYKIGEGSAYLSIADVYSNIGNSKNALQYYNKSIINQNNEKRKINFICNFNYIYCKFWL